MATIVKRGNFQFQAQVRRKGYPSQTATFESRTDAQKWIREVESQMDSGTFKDRKALAKVTLHAALERYATEVTPKKRSAPKELQRIRQLQRHRMAARDILSLTSDDYTRYKDERLAAVSPTTVRLELALLSNLYTIGNNLWKWAVVNEVKLVPKPPAVEGRERILVDDEAERLIAAIRRPQARVEPVWLEGCVRLAIETGMRAGELLSLEWHQVDLNKGVARLDMTKNGSRRSVPLTLAAVEVLAGLPRSGPRVIAAFYDTSGLDRAFKRACKAAGIEGLRFHDLRHHAATFYAAHMKVQQLAKVMGWKTLSMAMRYYNPQDKDLVDLVRNAKDAANAAKLDIALTTKAA